MVWLHPGRSENDKGGMKREEEKKMMSTNLGFKRSYFIMEQE